jgi:hypothetical protein
MRRSLIAIASLAVLPAALHAQARGGMMARSAPAMSAPAPHFAMRGAASMPMTMHAPVAAHTTSGVRVVPGSRWVRTRSGAIVLRPSRPANTVRNNSVNRPFSSQDAPGLGFDFPHFAATHPGRDRDHDRFHNRGFVGAFIPFFGGGGYYMPLFPDDVEEAPAAEAPPAEVAQAEPEEPPYPAYPPYPYGVRPPEPAPSPAPQAQAAREPEADQYVFVRRDGTVFFAVAYAWENSTLRYVTNEGLRRSIERNSLDLDATQQFNEQRGLAFHAPA